MSVEFSPTSIKAIEDPHLSSIEVVVLPFSKITQLRGEYKANYSFAFY